MWQVQFVLEANSTWGSGQTSRHALMQCTLIILHFCAGLLTCWTSKKLHPRQSLRVHEQSMCYRTYLSMSNSVSKDISRDTTSKIAAEFFSGCMMTCAHRKCKCGSKLALKEKELRAWRYMPHCGHVTSRGLPFPNLTIKVLFWGNQYYAMTKHALSSAHSKLSSTAPAWECDTTMQLIHSFSSVCMSCLCKLDSIHENASNESIIVAHPRVHPWNFLSVAPPPSISPFLFKGISKWTRQLNLVT